MANLPRVNLPSGKITIRWIYQQEKLPLGIFTMVNLLIGQFIILQIYHLVKLCVSKFTTGKFTNWQIYKLANLQLENLQLANLQIGKLTIGKFTIGKFAIQQIND